MKNIIALLSFVLVMTSCSEGSKLESADEFNTQIMIDGVLFTPTRNTSSIDNISTSFVANESAGTNIRTFTLRRTGSNQAIIETLELTITYPYAQASINGDYSFDPADFQADRSAQGSFTSSSSDFLLYTGTLTVTELNDNEFRLEFNNVTATDISGSAGEIIISGQGEGTFAN